jgi:DNA-binding transcriptional LysR family regulator
MDYEQMRAFLTVAQTKSFTRTAELLHVTQSTITTRIKSLEEHLGKPLFLRNRRQVELTPTGQLVYPYIKRVLELVRECETVTQLEEQYDERIVIGSVHSLWDYTLGPLVNRWRYQHPKTALRLVTGHSVEIVQGLLDGIIDLGIIYIPPQHPELQVTPLFQNTIDLVAHPDFPCGPRPLTADDLKKLPFLFLDWGPPFDKWLAEEMGAQYLPALHIDHASLLMQYLTEGEGISFTLHSVARPYLEKGILKQIPYHAQTPPPQHTAYLVHLKRKGLTPTLQSWVEYLKRPDLL